MKKGFTLIEVLGVIVVLAVIALITTPIIMNVIEKAEKGALEDSAYGLLDSANIYYASGILDETQAKTEFTFSDGVQTSENKLSYKGKVENGSVRLYSDGKSALCITGGEYAALKNVNDKKVSITRGRCSYNSETEEYETVGICQDLQDEIDALKKKHQEELDKLKEEYEEKIKQAGSDKEQLIKDHEAQIKTLTEAYEAQIKELNNQLNVFKNGGTATADQILAGKTAFVKGQLITGTMVNRGAVNATINPGESYTIPAGYHNGSGRVTSIDSINSGQISKTSSNIWGTISKTLAKDTIVYWIIAFDWSSNAGENRTFPMRAYVNGAVKKQVNCVVPQWGHNASVLIYSQECKKGDVISASISHAGYGDNYNSIEVHMIYNE